jgi:Mce-associated membrane protein
MTSPAETDPGVESADTPDPDASAETEATPPRSKLPTIALTAAVALLVAALAVAGWFGVAWFNAANDDGLAYSGVRDEVDRVARAAIVTMNTLDYRKLDEGLGNWSDATTGPLHDEISKLSDGEKQQLKDLKAITSGTVTSSAVKELDDRGGKAVVLAAVAKTVATADGEPKTEYQRVQATLLRTEDGWKLESLTPVPYAQPQ